MKADQVLWEKHHNLLWLIRPIAHDSKANFQILPVSQVNFFKKRLQTKKV